MTDDERSEPVRVPPPPRRRKPSATKRTPPPPRKAKGAGAVVANVAGGSSGNAAEPSLAALISEAVGAAVAPLQAQVDRLQSGQVRYIESEPESVADQRAVNPESMDPFTRKLWEERTHDVPSNYGGDREPPYNIPLARYLKPDGTYVWLQGDAKNRRYYGEKGYYCLSDAENAEVDKLQPQIVSHQREQAHLITAIRRLIDTDSALVGHRGDADADNELNLLSIAQLHQTWRDLCSETSQPERKLPAMKRFRSEGRDKMLDGVETIPPRARVGDFESEQAQAKGRRVERLVEVTPANARQYMR